MAQLQHQFVGRGKRPNIADAFKEFDAQLPAVQVAIEIYQINFQLLMLLMKCRLGTQIGHSCIGSSVDRCAKGVNAIGRKDFCAVAQTDIRRRETQRSADVTAVDNGAGGAIGGAEHRIGESQIAGLQCFAYFCRADPNAVEHNRLVAANGEPPLRCQIRKTLEIVVRPTAEHIVVSKQ